MPIKRRKSQTLVVLFFITAFVFIDQYLKAIVSSSLRLGESRVLIKNFLYVTLVRNTGAAFGLFKNSTAVFIAVSIVSVLFIALLIVNSIKKGDLLYRPMFNMGLILILSGAFGNLIDRIRLGYVIDFIDVRIWPVFNIADSIITIGAILILLPLFATVDKDRKPA